MPRRKSTWRATACSINTEQWNGGHPFGHLQAMDWQTGRLLWSHAHAWWPPGSPVFDAARNAVIATCNDHTVICVDADTGSQRWKQATQGMVRGKPAVGWSARLPCHGKKGGCCVSTSKPGENPLENPLRPRKRPPVRAGARRRRLRHRWPLALHGIRHPQRRNPLADPVCAAPPTGTPCAAATTGYCFPGRGNSPCSTLVRELKRWEGSIGGRYRQPPAVGTTRYGTLLAAASNNHGLKSIPHPPALPVGRRGRRQA